MRRIAMTVIIATNQMDMIALPDLYEELGFLLNQSLQYI
jgi:hypothetical protein